MISGPNPRRVVRRPGGSGGRVRKHERAHPVRVRRGEQRSHHRSLIGTQQHGALDPDGIHDRAHVAHPLLQERKSVDRNRIRQTDPTLVERDHATERREPAEVVRKAREVPARLDMAEPGRDENEIGRPFAHDLIRDVNVTRLRISRLRRRHSAMRMRGLEPPRPEGHTDLNRARLPIPPHPRGRQCSHLFPEISRHGCLSAERCRRSVGESMTSPPAHGDGRTIFLIDGWSTYRRSLRLFVEAAGYRVVGEADSTPRAAATASLGAADVVILDPDGSGVRPDRSGDGSACHHAVAPSSC